jgi:hypothetical protein
VQVYLHWHKWNKAVFYSRGILCRLGASDSLVTVHWPARQRSVGGAEDPNAMPWQFDSEVTVTIFAIFLETRQVRLEKPVFIMSNLSTKVTKFKQLDRSDFERPSHMVEEMRFRSRENKRLTIPHIISGNQQNNMQLTGY